MVTREIKYGNDFFQNIKGEGSNVRFKSTYWDLWISIVLKNIFNDDFDKMIDYIYSEKSTYQKRNTEGVINHINLLKKSLSDKNISISDIIVGIDEDFLKKQKIKSQRKILEMRFKDQEKSTWMINTPRELRKKQAMRGHWENFPVNPSIYSPSLGRCYKSSGFYSKNQSFTLEKKIRNYIKREEKETDGIEELFALYRATLTVMLEKMEMVDDSYGVIGGLYGEIFEKYFQLDRKYLEMGKEKFFLDFIELILWEDYGSIDYYQNDFIRNVTPEEIELVRLVLSNQAKELSSLKFDYFEKKCKKLLAKLHRIHKRC